MTRHTMTGDYEALAKQAAHNHERFESFCWHERPEDDDKWTIVYTSNRDSGLLDQSNEKAITEALEPFTEGEAPDVVSERHSHWAVGHVDGFAIRVYDSVGAITPAFKMYCDCMEALANYPVLNDEDYSQREYDATCENIDQQSGYMSRKLNVELPDNATEILFNWFWDNDQGAVENRDDQGGYPSDQQIETAFIALGWSPKEQN